MTIAAGLNYPTFSAVCPNLNFEVFSLSCITLELHQLIRPFLLHIISLNAFSIENLKYILKLNVNFHCSSLRLSFDASAIFLELEPNKPPLFNYAQANEFGEKIWLLSDGLTSRLLTIIGSRTKSITRPIYCLMKHGRA